jgi:AAA domain
VSTLPIQPAWALAERAQEERWLAVKPTSLILDPFVRLHRIDENSSAEVAPLLAYLRELQRRHVLAVLLVHHAKKTSGHVRAGQALRAPPSSTLGATRTCTCADSLPANSSSASSIAPPPQRQPSRLRCNKTGRHLRSRSLSRPPSNMLHPTPLTSASDRRLSGPIARYRLSSFETSIHAESMPLLSEQTALGEREASISFCVARAARVNPITPGHLVGRALYPSLSMLYSWRGFTAARL